LTAPDIKLVAVRKLSRDRSFPLQNWKSERAIYQQMMIILPKGHRSSKQRSIRIRDLAGEQYVQRAFCEFGDMIDVRDMVDKVSDADSARCEAIYKSDRDDWGTWDGSKRLRLRVFAETFDSTRGHHRAPARRSGILAEYSLCDGPR
jgi:hypothetical protein